MFYAHFVLAKKGPMARIWLAAHWDKKLTKAHVCETNIETSVDGILEPKVKMALRTTGHLLLGIVRIYSRKAKYLLADCNEAFMKIKMAFRPGMVDLPEENREAAVNAITLPEVFHNFENFRIDFEDLELQEQLANTLVMRPEEITLREVYGRLDVDFDNGFGEVQPDLDDSASGSGNDVGMSELRDSVASEQLREASLQVSMNENFASKRTTRSMQSRFLQTRFLDESAKPAATAGGGTQFLTDDSGSTARGIFDDLSELHRDDGGLSRPGSNRLDGTLQFDEGGFDDFGGDDLARPATPSEAGLPEPDLEVTFRQPQLLLRPSGSRSLASVGVGSMSEHTTLLHDEAESFALEPVDASAIRGQARPKRKRRLIVDNVKSMSAEDMKSQMLDSEDILIPLDLAPPTKKLMVMQEVGATDRLFAFPVRGVFSRELLRQFHVRALLPPEEAEEIFGLLGDSERDWLGLDRTPAPHRSHENTPKKQGKKRKAPAEDEPPASTTTINKRADKENMPPPTCATPSRAHPPTPGPSSVLNSPSIVRSGNRLVTPSFSGNTPSKLAASKYPPTPGNAGTHSIDEPHFESNDFGDFDDYDLGGEWNPPALDEPASSPARRSVVTPASHSASQSRRGLSSAMSDVSEQRVDGEASEAFEERTRQQKIDEVTVWLKSRLVSGSDSVAFSKLTEQVRRKEAAQRFYSLLVLKKQNVVDVSQDTDSDEIKIVRGPCFETAAVC